MRKTRSRKQSAWIVTMRFSAAASVVYTVKAYTRLGAELKAVAKASKAGFDAHCKDVTEVRAA